MRELATVQTIKSVTNLSHKLECAEILNQKVAVPKGMFKVGDKCVYVVPDAVLPPNHIVFGTKRSRETSISAKNDVVTKGYAFPLTDIEASLAWLQATDFEDGDDLTEFLSITEVASDTPIADKYKLDRPKFIPKKTVPYVEDCLGYIKEHKKDWHTVTELLDGRFITYYYKDGEFGICADDTGISLEQYSFYQKIPRRTDMIRKMDIMRNILQYDFAVQGYLVGKTINGNPYKFIGYNYYMSNFINLDAKKSIFKNPDHAYDEVFHTLGGQSVDVFSVSRFLNVHMVPYVTIDRATANAEEMNKRAKGDSAIAVGVPRKGIVYRKLVEDELDYSAFICLNPQYYER